MSDLRVRELSGLHCSGGRERVLAAIRHELPDRVPVSVQGWDCLEEHLSYFGASTDAELRRLLCLDMARADPAYVGPEIPNGGTFWGTPGIGDMAGFSEGRAGHPLTDATTVADVGRHPWPSPDDFDYDVARQGLLAVTDGQSPLLSTGLIQVFLRLLDLFGMETAMVNMYVNPAVIEAAVAHIEEFALEYLRRLLDAAGHLADVVRFGDDFATQRGLMISPEHFRRFLKPTYARVFQLIKSDGLYVWCHACGTFPQVLPDLIDIGADVWETVQAHLPGNEPERLKREYGSDLAFFGGIATQNTLPFGTPDDVRAEVRDRIRVLGRGGGYICGPDHNVRPDIPMENFLAMIDEVHRFRCDGCTAE